MTAPRLGLIGQLNEAAALVAGAGLDAWDALAAGADAPRARLLNVRARVALARERLQRVKGSEVAAAAALDLAGVDALASLDASEATLAAVARRLHEEAHGLWMTLPEGERERLGEAQDAASETVDGYLSKRERALDRGAAEVAPRPSAPSTPKASEDELAAFLAHEPAQLGSVRLTRDEVATVLGCSAQAVSDRVRRGTFPAHEDKERGAHLWSLGAIFSNIPDEARDRLREVVRTKHVDDDPAEEVEVAHERGTGGGRRARGQRKRPDTA